MSSESILIVIVTFRVINMFLSDSDTPLFIVRKARSKFDKTRELPDLVYTANIAIYKLLHDIRRLLILFI